MTIFSPTFTKALDKKYFGNYAQIFKVDDILEILQ